jgi:RNA polymerase sigma factor (sigma-70 family)
MSIDPLSDRCRLISNILLRANNWTLVQADDATFANTVLKRIRERYSITTDPSDISDEAIRQATKNVYSTQLHEAFGLDGDAKQIIAMTEMKRFVYRRLLMMTEGDEMLADICAQDAVTQAWRAWKTVREPGTFLGFVLRIGIHEKLAWDRKNQRLAGPLDDADGEKTIPAALISQTSVEAESESNNLQRQVRTAIERCLPKQLEAHLIVELFLKGKPFKELAEATGIRIKSLHMLKFRALRKLQKCQDFVELWGSWRGQV